LINEEVHFEEIKHYSLKTETSCCWKYDSFEEINEKYGHYAEIFTPCAAQV
jgi:hypothetical protein